MKRSVKNQSTKVQPRSPSRKTSTTPQKSGYGSYTAQTKVELIPQTDRQRILISTINASDATFATGSAGTGKTWCSVLCGVLEVLNKNKDRLILTKPSFEIDSPMGFLPGDEQEKTAPLRRSMIDILNRALNPNHVECLMNSGKVVYEPLANILGLTFDNAFIVVDESQHMTPMQMKALLTRVGNYSKIVMCGDYKGQKFLGGRSGLEDALARLGNLPNVGHIDFTSADIVRSGFCRQVVEAYDTDEDLTVMVR